MKVKQLLQVPVLCLGFLLEAYLQGEYNLL